MPAKKAVKSPAKKAAKKVPIKPAPKPVEEQSPSDAVDTQLARYRSMRDFNTTAEPSGAGTETSTASPKAQDAPKAFCIQKHAASHLHYDFRLAWNGVLKSWACAKGPSYTVKDRRLAVQVEDHPIDYGGFEGIIPAGQYGGGTVMLWDQGTWEPQPGHTDVDAGLRDGALKFILHGTRLQGKWTLIRMADKPAADGKKSRWSSSGKPNWLLIKEHDDFERPPESPTITDEAQTSVVTGRTMEEIAANQDHVWNSKETATPGQAWFRQEDQNRVPHASTVSSSKGGVSAKPAASKYQPTTNSRVPHSSQPHRDEWENQLSTLPPEPQPTFLPPQLAQETTSPPEGSGWLHELKLDGYRMQARKSGKDVTLLTRSGLDWTARMSAVAAEIARLPVNQITLDGEVVVLSETGATNFADLQAAFQEGARNPLTYFAFDLLHLEGHNPRDLPLRDRKALLTPILAAASPALLQLSEHLETDGLQMFHKACELHAEGIISKRASAPYAPGRTSSWLKSKCLHEQEFVIGGFTLPGKGKAGGPGIGALLLGYYDDSGKKLIYAGRTGTGFTQKFSAELRKRLEPMQVPTPPFAPMPSEARRGAQWVRPDLVAQVRFATWTAEDQLRQAAFLGLREDKPPTEVRRELAAPTPKSQKPGAPSSDVGEIGEQAGVSAKPRVPKSNSAIKARVPHSSQPHRDERDVNSPPATKPSTPLPSTIRLTHPAKIIDPSTSLTKQQLADFYWAVAPLMLPHITARPLSLVRCPEGSEKPCFFQKHVTHLLPPGITSIPVPDKKTGTPEPYITLSTPEALAGLAQIGVLEVHPWGSTNADLEHPNQLTIDLDPDESLPWPTLTAAALEVRDTLQSIGLASWVKTTGGKGLHVVIPIQPTVSWTQAKDWCHTLVTHMAQAKPTLYLTKMTKAARTGRIYLDYLRNERGATAVAPYSPRARAGCGVAVPLAWSELSTPTRPIFRVTTFPEWQSRLQNDPWSTLLTTTQSLPT